MLKLVLVILALICFAIAWSGKFPPYNWLAGGLFFVTAAVLLPL